MEKEHLLLLGATGLTGLAFIDLYLSHTTSTRPYLTLYVRSIDKLPSSISTPPAAKVRIVTGSLELASQFACATECAAEGFPPVTTVIISIGSYLSVSPIVTRFLWTQPTPLTEAFSSTIVPQLKRAGVKRIMTLSTPASTTVEYERKNMSLKWRLAGWMPYLFAPQGHEEMKGLARVTMTESDGLEWTVFRVPHLTLGPDTGVVAGLLDEKYGGSFDLSRAGLARWIWDEIKGRKWVGQMVMLGNA
ncbi:hypothetical protein H2200_013056 [Cladophialophora chaetospira]|uniref:NAD(P)-binding domain-containing protein n=1 Tax=Cladophialophora chaetospira TaxID=386627 RepID=A0AA38WWN3_9EURO|nr:hypothetical protein H2200_013056 [Cladophialophora chaetospira]